MGVASSMKGIVIAGGKGTRFSNPTNKSLLLYDGKPLIFYNIEMLLSYCDDVTVVTGYDSEQTVAEVGNSFPQVNFLHSDNGVVNAFKDAIEFVDDCVITCFGDELAINNNMEGMIDYYNHHDRALFNTGPLLGVIGACTNAPIERIKKCFSLQFSNDGGIRKIVEKPTKIINNWHGTGYGIFKKEIVKYINKQTNIPSVYQTAINNMERIYAYNLTGQFYNINYQEDYNDLVITHE